MEVTNVAYSRMCNLSEKADHDYKVRARSMTDQIYEKVVEAVPGIYRVDAILSKNIWKPTAECIDMVEFVINNRIPVVIRVDDCLQSGWTDMADKLISYLRPLLRQG